MANQTIEMKSNSSITVIACAIVIVLMNIFFLPTLGDNSFMTGASNISFGFMILFSALVLFLGIKADCSFIKLIPIICFAISMTHWFNLNVNMFIAGLIIGGTAVAFTFITMFVDGWWKFYKAEQAKWNKT